MTDEEIIEAINSAVNSAVKETSGQPGPPLWLSWATPVLIAVCTIILVPWATWVTKEVLQSHGVDTRNRLSDHLLDTNLHDGLRITLLTTVTAMREDIGEIRERLDRIEQRIAQDP